MQVLSLDLKDNKEPTECIERGNEFQSLGQATENAREHNTVLVQGTARVKVSMEREQYLLL